MAINKLDNWPSPEVTKKAVIFSLILIVIIIIIMAIFLTPSGGTTILLESQLSFDGFKMKMEYLPMVLFGDINAYRIVQILDFVFMVGYGTLIFSLALLIGRKFDPMSNWRKSSYIFAIFGIVAAFLDVGENTFILLTLTNPLFFPDWWTFAQSCFALPKWIIIICAIIWAIIAVIKIKMS